MSGVILLLIFVAALVGGLRFRSQPIRTLLEAYRNPYLPTYMRNATIATPFVAAVLLPPLVALVLLFGGFLDGVHLPHHLQGFLVYLTAGWFFTTFALFDAALYRPPRWMIPPWLREDDERVGFVPPPPDWFEKILLLAGLPFLLVGLAAFGASLAYLFGVLR